VVSFVLLKKTGEQPSSHFSRLAATQRKQKKHMEKYLLQIPEPSVKKTFKRKKQKDSCRRLWTAGVPTGQIAAFSQIQWP